MQENNNNQNDHNDQQPPDNQFGGQHGYQNQVHNNQYNQPDQSPNQYNPYGNQNWYQNQPINYNYKPREPWSKKKKILIGVLIGVGVIGLVASYFASYYAQRSIQSRMFSGMARRQARFSNLSKFSNLPQNIQQNYRSEMHRVCIKIGLAVDQYKKNNNSTDLRGLDVTPGTLRRGFISNSPLYDMLGLDYNDLASEPNFDPGDYYIVFLSGGLDGRYKVVCDPQHSGMNGGYESGVQFTVMEYFPDERTFAVQGFGPDNFNPDDYK